jgi:hypothetical protein
MTMKALLGSLAVLLAMVLTSCSKTDMSTGASEKQINLVQTALGQARSWHASSTFAVDGEASHMEEDLGCPFNYHRVAKVLEGQRKGPDEIIATQKGSYYREDEHWNVLHPPPNDYCKDGPNAGAFPLAETLEVLKRRTTLKKADTQSIDGASCREFDFVGVESPREKVGSLCIDEQTNLPFEFRYRKDIYRYSKWNEPVTLEPPPGL